MKENDVTQLSKVVSAVASPLYMPVIGLLALFTFSYLSLLNWQVKLYILIHVVLFTIMLPTTLIRIYCRYRGWNKEDLKEDRQKQTIPFVITMANYFWCYYCLSVNHVPYTIRCILVAAMMVLIICALIQRRWHISIHTAAMGALTGAVVAFAEVFSFNTTWWLCLILLMAGMVGSSRMQLQGHTLGQVVGGYFIGMACALLSI
ncbi:MAG: phosphatase PAP2 family protein [Prevotella sp.]|nr:phosphatase PAP2 family protein [Prevotella sp.]